MNPAYVYLSYDGEEPLALFVKMMNRLLKAEVQVDEKGGGRALVTLPNGSSSLAVFRSSFSALCVDNEGIGKALILPSPSPLFYGFLDFVEDKNVDDVAHLSLSHPEIYDESMGIFESVDREDIEAALAYISSSCSPSAASLEIFVHKNTVSNRVKRFENKTGIDLSLFPNQLFIYLLGNEWKRTL